MDSSSSGHGQPPTARSLAVQYEIRLKEELARHDSGKGPSSERMLTCFEILDELVPKLGVYRPIVQLLRNELYEAVYSDEYTSTVLVPSHDSVQNASYSSQQPSQHDGALRQGGVNIHRIPYFTLVFRLFHQRNEKALALQDQLLKLTDRMKLKDDQLSNLEKELSTTRSIVVDLENGLTAAREELDAKASKIDDLQSDLRQQEKNEDESCLVFRRSLDQLKEDLSTAQSEINKLHHFRANFQATNEKFASAPPVTKRVNTAFSTKQSQLQNNLNQAQRLQQQLLNMQNTILEEYDIYIEGKKHELSKYNFDQLDKEDPLTQELSTMQERFKRGIVETTEELSLLSIHIESLDKELKLLKVEQEQKRQHEEMLKAATSQAGGQNQERTTDKHKDTPPDPLAPQERLLSKYGAMILTSCNKGLTFTALKGTRLCPSCGEKTMICPHRLLDAEHVIQLPVNCTHLKITRPAVRILNTHSLDTSHAAVTNARTGFAVDEEHLRGAQEDQEMTFQRLWDDFQARSKQVHRAVPRKLTMERCTSLIEQFYTRVVWEDEFDIDEEPPVSMLDMLYRFFSERYLLDEVSLLGTYDFLQATVSYTGESRMVRLFAQQLSGLVDPACFRYVLLLCELIESVQWRLGTDFEVFATVAYSMTPEEDLEQTIVGFESFGGSKISAQLLYEYLLYLLLNRREPAVTEWQNRLHHHPCREPGWMNEIEFAECLDHICPLVSEKLRRRLFCESAAHLHGHREQVPCTRLGYITAYLSLLKEFPAMKELLQEKMAKRHGIIERELNVQDQPHGRERQRRKGTRLSTMTSIKSAVPGHRYVN